MKIIYSNMFYAKIFHLLSVSANKFPNIIDKISSFKAHFRLYIKQRSNFEKSLSTFQPFTYVSNELYLINEMCIEGFSQRLESRIDQFWLVPKNLTKLPKIMIFTRIREIDQWSYEWKCFSVISCLPEMVFCIYIWLKSVDSGSFLCIG